jgi:RHS repeat-associated protein
MVGLAVTSSNTAALTTATFAKLSVNGSNASTVTPTLARSFVYGDYIDEPLVMVTASSKYYIHSNHLYSVAAITNSTGAVVERFRYDAYGKQIGTSTVGFNRGFTGYQLDTETGLYFARARMYSPTLGRFVSRDPIGYVDGDSLYAGYFVPGYVDPFGLCPPYPARGDDMVQQMPETPILVALPLVGAQAAMGAIVMTAVAGKKAVTVAVKALTNLVKKEAPNITKKALSTGQKINKYLHGKGNLNESQLQEAIKIANKGIANHTKIIKEGGNVKINTNGINTQLERIKRYTDELKDIAK